LIMLFENLKYLDVQPTASYNFIAT
jgi:hypothetical protein